MELWKKGVLAYVGLTLGLIFIAEGMKANGGAYPGNRAWDLVYHTRNIFLGPWVLLLAAVVLFCLIAAIVELREAREKRAAAKQREEEERREEVAREWRRIEGEKQRLESQAKDLERLERELRARYEAKTRELEKRHARTTEDAVEEALDDFG